MKTDAILKADILDIIFENKNKMYGAYTLRKFYNNRLYKALGIMMGLVGIFCLFSFMVKEKVIIDVTGYEEPPAFAAPPKDSKKPEPPIVKSQPIPATAAVKPNITTQDNSRVVLTNEPVTAVIKDLVDGVQTDTRDNIGDPGKDPIITKPIPKTDSIGTAIVEPVKPIIDKVTPNETAEVMPKYPGGMEKLRKFLQENLTNPKDVEEGETVSVKIKFIVGYDGKLKGFETIEDGGDAFNKEVIRVLKKMPDWIAGKSKGESVSVYYTIPVKFTSITE
jgi:periplasmic protein TonB